MTEFPGTPAPGLTVVAQVQRTSGAGIVLPSSDEEDKGRIVAVGDDAYQNGVRVHSESRKHIGRKCAFTSAYPIEIQGTKYLLVKEENFLAFFD